MSKLFACLYDLWLLMDFNGILVELGLIIPLRSEPISYLGVVKEWLAQYSKFKISYPRPRHE